MRDRLRILLLGGTGQIGGALKTCLAPLGDVIAPTRSTLDCSRLGDVERFIAHVAPECVVNAAAYTQVDKAENDRVVAQTLNSDLPRTLAVACHRLGVGLVHYSTDYVFGGDGHRPYREDDVTAPANWYGATKLAGEAAILSATDRAVILRTSWIYGRTGSNFFRTMLRLAREREEIRVVDDQVGSPTWSHSVAEGTSAIIGQLGRDTDTWQAAAGVYHMTAGGSTTWHGFATRLLELDPNRNEHAVRRVIGIPTSEYPTPAQRPAYSVLDCSRLAERLGVRLPEWQVQLALAWQASSIAATTREGAGAA